MIDIYEYIAKLVKYGEDNEIISKYDRVYVINSLLELFELEDYYEDSYKSEDDLEKILEGMLDYAYDKGLIKENTTTYRDLFDTKIMSKLTPPPSSVIEKFNEIYKKTTPKNATSYLYKFNQDINYIRRYRIAKDVKWKTETEFGKLDITINLSKPEKDPKEIAAAKKSKKKSYPKCQLCIQNEGYAGRVNHPARGNHRIIPLVINGQEWGFQYSPYVYYNEHCIVLNSKHVPMVIDEKIFKKLFDFVKIFPHYFVGSNADLPIVGGSILTHEHFQGGNYDFAMAKAPVEREFKIKGFEDIKVGIVKWPMSVIRLRAKDTDRLSELGTKIFNTWKEYNDEKVYIYAYTEKIRHNTITPIARKRGAYYELDIVLRNNITTNEHPLGLYHPHAELHHIKKENIGLIEVMGLAVLPSRLKEEMKLLGEAIIDNRDFKDDEKIGKHYDWFLTFKDEYQFNRRNTKKILKIEIGKVFLRVLEDAGVFKRDDKGKEAFARFMRKLNK
ncbi:UDP-glucose--hexose-1-phosphate uridylyltransferase [uncultured Eubacterium sp.]|uniref:UDP-glucose--hexose-1-phosphate uridylyltransferase n=1 Tax=uncultured Eubacterium sp. TaxID=165185 RepID=UPI000E90D204|nr:UDP-glucose--hexose-1-phosphate uridylyltransferase [uncultured Eubacterium sp.]HAH17682.1 UDP-glucose--hexose-1-phosphate uridylyltransferase [Eubacterium sp.]HAV90483.1 UDP-glucose--hexose-1-phosphate uridylyltransferase [Eubacterium sp.]